MNQPKHSRLILPDDYDTLADELAIKGFCPVAQVSGADGAKYPVYFVTVERLQQLIIALPWRCVCEPGMIVVNDITRAEMEAAAEAAWEQGFFAHLRPS